MPLYQLPCKTYHEMTLQIDSILNELYQKVSSLLEKNPGHEGIIKKSEKSIDHINLVSLLSLVTKIRTKDGQKYLDQILSQSEDYAVIFEQCDEGESWPLFQQMLLNLKEVMKNQILLPNQKEECTTVLKEVDNAVRNITHETANMLMAGKYDACYSTLKKKLILIQDFILNDYNKLTEKAFKEEPFIQHARKNAEIVKIYN
jgi:hypothetical protein